MLPGSHKSKGKQSTNPLNLITANVFFEGGFEEMFERNGLPKSFGTRSQFRQPVRLLQDKGKRFQ